MKLNSLKWPLSTISGAAIILIFNIFTLTSIILILLYPRPFNPFDNYISDLGNSRYNPKGALIFDIGLILGGIAYFPFYIGFYKWYTNDSRNKILLITTQIIGCFLGFIIILLGFFSADYKSEHTFLAGVFFILHPLVLILTGIALYKHSDYIKESSYLFFIAASVNLLFIFWNVPIIEWITFLAYYSYFNLIAYNAYKVDVK